MNKSVAAYQPVRQYLDFKLHVSIKLLVVDTRAYWITKKYAEVCSRFVHNHHHPRLYIDDNSFFIHFELI